ncbi:diacylglycerol/lipid kinase family protein [Azospirillum halopraeferens]|uniref:diacylglycerol/lipid kinase family protein n=1 Tax=Azospirillum halopraeferens TaxID=34010 RepID=UPI00042154AC|nr:diacylglycerol kinase family protein [Azospirillum halopraeferens]
MKVAIVLNRSAGALSRMPADTAAAAIGAIFAGAGAEVGVDIATATTCRAAIARAAASDADAVVVGGGDGTVATAVNLLVPVGKPLGVLPLGTMNLLARELGTPPGLTAAARAVAHGRPRAIDVAEVNGELFLNHSALGIYPAMVQERERQRVLHGLGKWPAMALAAVKALHRLPVLDVAIDLGEGPQRVRTPVLVVSNNPYAEGYGPVLRRATLDGGRLGVYVARHRSGWAMLRLMTRLMLGTWQEDEELVRLEATGLTVHSRRRRLRIANDGEIRRPAPPLVYRIRPRALRILQPMTNAS